MYEMYEMYELTEDNSCPKSSANSSWNQRAVPNCAQRACGKNRVSSLCSLEWVGTLPKLTFHSLSLSKFTLPMPAQFYSPTAQSFKFLGHNLMSQLLLHKCGSSSTILSFKTSSK